jgi:hypothetical protein
MRCSKKPKCFSLSFCAAKNLIQLTGRQYTYPAFTLRGEDFSLRSRDSSSLALRMTKLLPRKLNFANRKHRCMVFAAPLSKLKTCLPK